MVRLRSSSFSTFFFALFLLLCASPSSSNNQGGTAAFLAPSSPSVVVAVGRFLGSDRCRSSLEKRQSMRRIASAVAAATNSAARHHQAVSFPRRGRCTQPRPHVLRGIALSPSSSSSSSSSRVVGFLGRRSRNDDAARIARTDRICSCRGGARRMSSTTTTTFKDDDGAGGAGAAAQAGRASFDSAATTEEVAAAAAATTMTNEGSAAASSYSPYEKLVRRLYMTNLFHPVKMGLQNIQALHDALGRPMDDPNVHIIHIAGTNGKGSVALKIAKSLQYAGHTVGLFVSPHVSSFRERMQLNGTIISESDVVRYLPRIYQICEDNHIPATFFEITTALAFLYFAESKANVVVLETGLGGRLDATNVVSHPDLSVITSIGLEHTRILGDTIELIALEKGGIIKEDCPVLVGPNVPHEVLRKCANEKGAEGYYTCEDVLGDDEGEGSGEGKGEGKGEDASSSSSTPQSPLLLHDYDLENSRIAAAALTLLQRRSGNGGGGEGSEEKSSAAYADDDSSWLARKPVTADHISLGTSHRPPCRFEVVPVNVPITGFDDKEKEEERKNNATAARTKPVTVVLDVAHNPSAMDYLVAKLGATYPGKPLRFVAGFSSDKDLAHCGQCLLSSVSSDPTRVHLVEASHPRAASVDDMVKALPELSDSTNLDDVTGDRSVTAQVKLALRMAAKRDELLVVCGSVFLMAEAREALGFDEPRDSECLAEVAGSNLKHGQENFGDIDPEKKDVAVIDDASASVTNR